MTASHNASGAGVLAGALRITRTEYSTGIATTIHEAVRFLPAGTYWIIGDDDRATIESAMALPGKWREVAAAAHREADSEASEALRSELLVEASAYRQNARALEAIFGPALPATDAPEPVAWLHTYRKNGRRITVADVRPEVIGEHRDAECLSIVPLYATPPAGGGDGMLPDELVPLSKEWYVLCERRFAVDRISISGALAEAIVAVVGRLASGGGAMPANRRVQTIHKTHGSEHTARREDGYDETPAAYKDIDAVMAAQADLVEVVHTLRQVVCVKG